MEPCFLFCVASCNTGVHKLVPMAQLVLRQPDSSDAQRPTLVVELVETTLNLNSEYYKKNAQPNRSCAQSRSI
jgi:hypothetical protein